MAVRRLRLLGAAALTVVLGLGIAGCSGPARQPTRSALSGGARTCVGSGAACAKSGSLRWSLPLAGTYREDDEGSELTPVSLDEENGALRVVADRDTVYLGTGRRVSAIDAATGRKRWSHASAGDATEMFMLTGRLLVEQRLVGGGWQYLSIDPRTGKARTIAVRARESLLGEWVGNGPGVYGPSEGLVLITGGIGSEIQHADVRRIEPVSGRTLWQTRLGPYSHYAARGGVLYVDDDRPRHDLPKGTKETSQTRAVQRLDLATGRRLPDVPLPRRYWGDHTIDYITADRTVVLSDSPADGGLKYAVDPHGRPVEPVPADDRPSSRAAKPADRVTAAGKSDGVQHLVASGPGAKRWTGPAMRSANAVQLVRTSPRLAIAAACAPDGARKSRLEDPFPGVICVKPRLFAMTW